MVILNIYTEFSRDDVATILNFHMTAFVKAALGEWLTMEWAASSCWRQSGPLPVIFVGI